jgi:predicted component of viral defense system (DUF524 family)
VFCRSLQDDFIEEFADKHIAKSQFVQLDRKLITLSLEQRAQILEKQRQINTYAECLRNILTDLKVCYFGVFVSCNLPEN